MIRPAFDNWPLVSAQAHGITKPPSIDYGDGPHITLPAPPGEYVLDEAQARHSYHSEWTATQVTSTATTAVRLLVSAAPAASWEMARRPDDDPRSFVDHQITGFRH
ncbi:hypothetical protein ACIQM4_28710 [Streptomyces sp. NPDC091272]|uniref:hypothetical protein n=1 Tax=Streptomyces sp. NPDC091272 TaxID=3365981 RepID=UPI003806A82E